MRKLFPLLALAAGAFGQTATYPSAIATDAALRVAVNNCGTTLSFPMLSSDTHFNVTNASCIVPNTEVTIDNEKIAICAVVGNVVSVGKSSCENVDGRGFDTTIAAAHANGTAVALNIDAWFHNALAAEVKAIETALGVGLANVLPTNPLPVNKGGTGAQNFTNFALLYGQGTSAFGSLGLGTTVQVLHGNAGGIPTWGQVALGTDVAGWPSGSQLGYLRLKPNAGNATTLEFAAMTAVSSTDYNFPAQTPGGTLTGGGGTQTVTMTPCPLGIVTSGTFATNLYISAGSGTAEWLRPSGGTCTSGATTGTVIISPVNNHSGAWTITSGAAGIDLACASSSAGAHVVIPPGSYNIFGTIRPTIGCTIDGQGTPSANGPSGAVFLHQQIAGVPLIDIATFGVTIKNIQLAYGTFSAYTVNGAVATAGSIGIQSGTTAAVDGTGNSPVIENVIANNFYNNLSATSGTIRIHGFTSLAAVQDGVVIGGTPGLGAGYVDSILAQGSGGNGYTLNGQAALQWHSVAAFNNAGWGMKTNSGAAFQMDDIDMEGDGLGEIFISAQPATVGILQNVILQSAGLTTSYGTFNTSPGLKVFSGVALGLVISNIQISNSEGNGMELDGTYLQLSNASIYSNGVGAQAGHTSCFTDAGVDQILTGINCFQGPVTISGGPNVITGNQFVGILASAPLITFTAASAGNLFCNNILFNPGNTAIQYDAGATGTGCPNNVNGTVTGRLGYDAHTLQTLAIAPIPNATALTVSTNTIAPTLPLHTLGAGLVKTITAPNAAVSGCFNIIATAAFTTDTTANIVTPAITATIGKLYHACYNAATTLWSLTN